MIRTLTEAVVADPVLAGAVVPLAVGLVAALGIRIGAGRHAGGYMPLGAVAAFLAVHVLIQGTPAFPAVSAIQKLFWLAIFGAAAGLVVRSIGRSAALERTLLILLPAVGVLWFGERQWLRGPETGFAVQSVLLWLVGAAILLRMRAMTTTGRGFAGGAQLIVAAAALSIIALFGASASLATLAGALAAGVGGFLLIDYAAYIVGGVPTSFGPVGRLGLAGPLIFIAAMLVLFNEEVSVTAVGLLSLVFVSARIPLRLERADTLFARILEPVWFAALAAIPAAIAIAVAVLQAELTAYP